METMTPFPSATPTDPLSNPNTLGKPLKPVAKGTLSKKELRKTIFFLSISIILLAVYSISFFLPKGLTYLETPGRMQELQSEISQYENVALVNLDIERDLHQVAYEKEFKEYNDALNEVFPLGVNKSVIVSTLENFASKINLIHPPFDLTGINIKETREVDGYLVTDVDVTIQNQSSRKAFDEFLKFIDSSGYLNRSGSQDSDDVLSRTPLMSAQKINVTYGEGENVGKVNFAISLQFYSRIDSHSNDPDVN